MNLNYLLIMALLLPLFSVAQTGPTTAPPVPTEPANEVISLFSDAYDDVTVTTFRTDWSVAELIDTTIAGNAVKLYRNLGFAGIETTGDDALNLDEAGVTHLHFDFWSANSTLFRVKLVDFGGDGFDGGNDTEFELPRTLAQGQWVSVDYPLAAFSGINKNDINQFIISSMPNGTSDVYLDNIYFYQGEVSTGEQVDLPVTFDDPDVNYELVDFEGTISMLVADPTDASNTVVETTKTAGAATFAGTTITQNLGGTPADPGFASRIPFTAEATTMTVRVWSPAADIPVRLKVESSADPTISVETSTLTTVAGAWDTLTFDFANEAPRTATLNLGSNYNKLTIFFNFGTSPDADATYYWDDVEFGGESSGNGGGGQDAPTAAAPTPTQAPEDVISLFSDAYNDVAVDTWLTTWSSAQLEDLLIEGNATKRYFNLDFAGVETTGENAIDLMAAGMTHLHFDYWTPNMDTLRIKLVDFGGDGFDNGTDTEDELIFGAMQNEWVSLDIPLENFEGMNMSDISQIIFSGLPAGGGTLFVDNFFFYKDMTDGVNTPVVGLLEAYPNPVRDNFRLTAPVKMKSVTLLGVSGAVIGRWTPAARSFDMDMRDLAPGVYVALVATDSGLMSIKILKQE